MRGKLLKFFSAASVICIVFFITALACRNLFPDSFSSYIDHYCRKYGVSPSLVYALIKAESNFDPRAVSGANAKGIMQITPQTFSFCAQKENISDADIFSIEDNIRAGVWYLSYLQARYDSDTYCILSAYNAGPSNVDKWLADKRCSKDGKKLDFIIFDETRRYVTKITQYKKIYEFLYPRLKF